MAHGVAVQTLPLMVRKKVAKRIAMRFPLNAVRIFGLRAAGYHVGRQVYVGEELQITDDLYTTVCRLTIGDRTAIAPRVSIILTSSPNHSRLGKQIGKISGQVWVGADAWIGAGAIILPNVSIGEAAIVGAGSVVTKDVPPHTVVAGNPARLLRSIEQRTASPRT
jgi:acetyltransferase-like isoleucine patch superfamily enzyme